MGSGPLSPRAGASRQVAVQGYVRVREGHVVDVRLGCDERSHQVHDIPRVDAHACQHAVPRHPERDEPSLGRFTAQDDAVVALCFRVLRPVFEAPDAVLLAQGRGVTGEAAGTVAMFQILK